MKVDGVAFKFKMQETRNADPLVVINLWIRNELNHAHILDSTVRATFWIVSTLLRKGGDARMKEKNCQKEQKYLLHAIAP
jgi:hypothetical protein